MNELLDILFAPNNIALTILLGMLFLYWIFSIVTGLDFDTDFDIDIDIDTDLDIDMDSSVELKDINSGEFSSKKMQHRWWQRLLIYFNFTDLPFMFVFTFWIFCWWALTISLTYVTESTHNSTGTILCLVLILPSLILSKWLSQPFKSFFKHLNKDGVEELRLEGKIGMLQSDLKDDKIGRVRIMINDDPILIYGKSKEAQALKANTEVYILQKSNDKKYYYVKPL